MPLLPLWDFVACSGVNFTFTFTFIIIIIVIIIRGGCVNIFVVTTALAPSTPGQNSGYFRSSIFRSKYNNVPAAVKMFNFKDINKSEGRDSSSV